MCTFSLFLLLHIFGHWSHAILSISCLLWMLIWRTKLALLEYIFPHRLQICCSDPSWWALLWYFKVLFSLIGLANGSFIEICNKFTGSTSSLTETLWNWKEKFFLTDLQNVVTTTLSRSRLLKKIASNKGKKLENYNVIFFKINFMHFYPLQKCHKNFNHF